MSRWARPRVSPPRSDEELSGWETAHLLMQGHAHTVEHPWEWESETAERLAAELDARLARKRPPGFAPWTEGA